MRALLLLVLTACASLRTADVDPDASAPPDPDGSTPVAPGKDASTDAPVTPPPLPSNYADAQALLESKRFPGPLTAQNSKMTCARKRLYVRDGDGKMHGWAGDTQTKIDYGFTAPDRPFPLRADNYLAVDNPGFTSLDVYDPKVANTKIMSIDYAFNFASADDGVVRADQRVANVDLNGTRVRKWHADTGTTEDVSAVLDTKQPPQGWGEGRIVIPTGVSAPFNIYIVDTVAKATTSVTFDGGTGVRDFVPSKAGLLVQYARQGGAGLRLYKAYSDASRLEIGDEVKNRPSIFTDGPATEHDVLLYTATYRNWAIYGSAYGIFAYEMTTGAITALQMGKDKKVMILDSMCVLADANLVVYRLSADPTGQVWAVPIADLLP